MSNFLMFLATLLAGAFIGAGIVFMLLGRGTIKIVTRPTDEEIRQADHDEQQERNRLRVHEPVIGYFGDTPIYESNVRQPSEPDQRRQSRRRVVSMDLDDQMELTGFYGDTPRRLELLRRQEERLANAHMEGMPHTWSHCGSQRPHGPHRHTVTSNEGPTDNVLCKGFPGVLNGDAPYGRIVYDEPSMP